MKRKYCLIITVAVLLISSLAGCGDVTDEIDEAATQSSLSEEVGSVWETEEAISQHRENEETGVSDEPVDDRIIDLTDYSSYLKKIWIMNEERSPKEMNVSLVITQIEDGFIQGYFKDNPYVYTYYFSMPRKEKSLPEFYGTIYDGTAECQYDYKDGKKGTLTITFCEDDRIEVTLDGKNSQCCQLRPYHISDEDYLNGEVIAFETELGFWGTVTLYAVNPFRTVSPQVFLLNEQGDILYKFFQFSSYGEILEITAEDMDEDGLEDVKIIASLTYLLSGDWVTYRYEYPYYQLEDGYFARGDEIILEESIEETKVSFDGFGEMDYALFLESNVGYGVTLNYYKYGIYGDFVNTLREGEEVYFELCKAMLGTEISWKTHEDWADSKEVLHIQNLSPDLQWIVARQYLTEATDGHYKDEVIYNGSTISEAESWIFKAETYFSLKETEQGTYELVDDELLEKREQLVGEMGGRTYIWALEDATCMDEYGRYLAIAAPDSQSIELYSTEDWSLRRRITIDSMDPDYPLAISQFVGDEDSGWLVFSNGDTTYRLNYPDGELEKIGEFMFDTTYSPDGKYLAYYTGNFELAELWQDMSDDESKLKKYYELEDLWDQISSGWYVREVETGNTAYIPIETWLLDGQPLYGGRCVWIEKDKLFQILNQ